MADETISDLAAVSAALGTHEIPVNESGVSKKLTVAQIAALIAPLTVSENFLTGDVNLTNINTFYDGPSLSLAAGTYILMGSVTIYVGVSGYVASKLWDGTNVWDSPGDEQAAGAQTQIVVFGTCVLGTPTTVKISSVSATTGSVMLATVLNGATHKGSHLMAIKIA